VTRRQKGDRINADIVSRVPVFGTRVSDAEE
jgi:hypothetical protein